MIEDENDPRLQAVATTLLKDIQDFIVGRPLDAGTLDSLGALIQRAQVEAKSRFGVILPKMIAMVIPRHRRIHLYRADLEMPAIMARVTLLTRQYPDLTREELTTLVGRAWPHYKLSFGDDDHGRA